MNNSIINSLIPGQIVVIKQDLNNNKDLEKLDSIIHGWCEKDSVDIGDYNEFVVNRLMDLKDMCIRASKERGIEGTEASMAFIDLVNKIKELCLILKS